MKVAYIAHPIGGNVLKNIEEVKRISREINFTEPDTIPFAPYILDCQAMNDSIPEHRNRGMKNNAALFSKGFIDELRLYGPVISKGMQQEIDLAKQNNIPVITMNIENHCQTLKVKCSELDEEQMIAEMRQNYDARVEKSLKYLTGKSPLQAVIERMKKLENEVFVWPEKDSK